ADLEEMARAWSSGDVAALERLVFDDTEDPRAQTLLGHTFSQRNARMAASVVALLEEGTPALVVVGAGHMVGTDGLPALLAARGSPRARSRPVSGAARAPRWRRAGARRPRTSAPRTGPGRAGGRKLSEPRIWRHPARVSHGPTSAHAQPRLDPFLLYPVLALVALGLVMVYSASAVTAGQRLGDSFYYVNRQAIAAGIGLVAMAAALKLGYRRLARLAYPLLIIAVILLIAVLIPGIGTEAGGARRWIRFAGGFSLQPAEVAKFAWVVYLSYSLAKKREKVATFSVGFLPHALMGGVLIILCLKQPDFGSSVLILTLMFVLLFAAGAKISYLVLSVLLA